MGTEFGPKYAFVLKKTFNLAIKLIRYWILFDFWYFISLYSFSLWFGFFFFFFSFEKSTCFLFREGPNSVPPHFYFNNLSITFQNFIFSICYKNKIVFRYSANNFLKICISEKSISKKLHTIQENIFLSILYGFSKKIIKPWFLLWNIDFLNKWIR